MFNYTFTLDGQSRMTNLLATISALYDRGDTPVA
jgi:hypothetical protein